MRLVEQIHDDVTTEPVRRTDLPDLDAAFTTSAGTCVCPVTAIDDVHWPADHPTVRLLRDRVSALPQEPVGPSSS